jgi:hypothetical protein
VSESTNDAFLKGLKIDDTFLKDLETMQREDAEAIAAAQVPTEKEMREAKVPWLDTPEQLADYIKSLVDRPHDYGTCVYAVSMAAVAAYQYVGRKLGTTGFQSSCADLDILRRARGWEWGRVLNYEDLLYPQYANRERFPTVEDLLYEHRAELAKRAAVLLEKSPTAHPDVLAHWRKLVAADA